MAANIRAARAAAGLTQLELARLAHCDSDQISKWERGVYMPSIESLAALAHALEKDIADFYAPVAMKEAA